MSRSYVVAVWLILPVFVSLGLASCAPVPSKPEGASRVPLSTTKAALFRDSQLGNAYDGQPEAFSSCVRWQGPGVYSGCARRVAKVSLVPESEAPTEVYESIAEFKREVLDAPEMVDSFMRNGVQPRLTSHSNNDRHPSERRNVAIDCLLIAVKHESDNDYHLILGDPGCNDPECFFNVEVSGLPLPDHPDFDVLHEIQDGFETFIDHANVSGSYHFWVDPPLARVSGSLFYDISHAAGQVGPAGNRPWTAWEIHPVRTIEIWEE